MAKKNVKLIGMDIEQFKTLIDEKQIFVRPARLIPSSIKAGDEMALCSIFLSALRLIKEFREDVFSDLKFRKGGAHYFYVETTFLDIKDARPDGLILNVVSGEIRDAVIMEVKNKHNQIDDTQIQKYIELAKAIGVVKILTISNQYVPDPSQSPVQCKAPKGIELYHYSWTALLTLAHVLLFQNAHNIEDSDQKALMKEIVNFFESKDSGILGFSDMKRGWKEVIKQFTAGTIPKKTSPEVIEAIESWQQEEKDMALKLSQKLGEMVKLASKQDLKTRFESDYKQLSTKKQLVSKLRVNNVVSAIEVIAHFERRTVTMSVELQAPDKTIRGQIGWLKKQIDSCAMKNIEIFTKIRDYLHIQPNLKYRNEYPLTAIDGLEKAITDLKGKEINSFTISYIFHLGAKFESGKKFVEIIESMLVDFYSSIVQHLTNPPPKTPQIKKKDDQTPLEEVGSSEEETAESLLTE
ncbi:hypothetical protein [Marispirochaeta sp.]|jgi:hypothetical protein|uniref:hypothetical protein n=1 Tax=Marispirochaeta sp. TaxID=2038653 RepID=UPI0029C738D3|nr:hypothetical protein [Marispirochaeta sp.]